MGARWRLQTICATCTPLWISARTMALTIRPRFSPWGAAVVCNRVGCDGVRTFRAWPPEIRRMIGLVGPRGGGEQTVVFNATAGVVTEKPRSLR